MAVPKVYRWDDAGAPTISGGVVGATNWVAILHACLVTGYGSKPAAGWVRQFVDGPGTIAVFQPASLEFGIQVDDTYSTVASSYIAADSWTNLTTSVGVWDTRQYVFKSSSSTITPYRPWMVIASDTFFLAFVWRSQGVSPVLTTNSDASVFGAGKYFNYYAGMPLPNCTVGIPSTTTVSFSNVFSIYNELASSNTRELTFQRGVDGATGLGHRIGRPHYAGRAIRQGASGYANSPYSGTAGADITSMDTGAYLYAPFYAVNYMGCILGRIPLVYGISGSIPTALRNTLIQDVVIQGKTWLLVNMDTHSTFTNRSYFLLDVYTDSLP